jgi:1-acyl-sn-glycerol-3-phosphate acyltransferase
MARSVQESTSHPLPQRNLETLTKTVFPALRALIDAGYFSLDVEGAAHVPRSGPVIYAANHAGWFTMDTIFGALVVADHVGLDRLPWPAGQDQMFKIPKLGRFFAESGVFPSSWLKDPASLPAEMETFCIYPEGVEGNCKSFLDAYQMREWRIGFLRLALARGATIVPLAILGSEECMPSIAPVRFLKPLLGTTFPLPLSLLPLPSRWKFIFHEPVHISDLMRGHDGDSVETQKAHLREIAAGLRERVQNTLDRETSDRALVRLSKFVKQSLG